VEVDERELDELPLLLHVLLHVTLLLLFTIKEEDLE
jgi:hypothetical protein